MASIWVAAKLEEPCEVCASYVPKLREMMGWKPVHGGRYYIGGTPDQKARLWNRINEQMTSAAEQP